MEDFWGKKKNPQTPPPTFFQIPYKRDLKFWSHFWKTKISKGPFKAWAERGLGLGRGEIKLGPIN